MTAPLRTCRTACGCACTAPGPGGVELHLRAGACYTEPCSCAGNLGVHLCLVLVCSRNNFAGMMKSSTSPSRQNHPLRLQPLGPIARHAIVPALCGERMLPATESGGGPAAVAAWRQIEAWTSRVRVCIGRWRWRPDSPRACTTHTPPSTHGPASPRSAPARSRMAPATSLRSGPSPRGRAGSPSRTTLLLACILIAPRAHGNPSLMECRVPAAPGVHERHPRAWRTWCCSRVPSLHRSCRLV